MMNDLNVWEVVSIKTETRLVGATWVFKTKRNECTEVLEYKARLCAQGFSQTPVIDFGKTFAPTGHLNSLQTLISFASSNNLKFDQLNIKSTFLNSLLKEEVFLAIPHSLDLDKKKLKPPIWLFIHVDDITVFGKDLAKFKLEIQQEFKTKLLGQTDLLLGIKIHKDDNSISLLHEHYVESLLDLYGMSNCRPVATPLVPNEHLDSPTQAKVDKFKNLDINYRGAIGSLN
ncbi:hypothetical protein O181_074972 [Austropuccinia psidii MF-1]|uniref:Reverse transcriptase Ty1/copia-type domain-containing protein n=1 Tax=Austropuccinia psidii MF-1 TaxID=1389203 RepID=A0A9Q3ICG3_9BASI|nr:hypothetical protein [Austropuccinia psidii MF-1]